MFDDEEYLSDTSDEDFVPTGAESGDDADDLSDDPNSENDDTEEPNEKKGNRLKRKNHKTTDSKAKKQRKTNPLLASLKTESQIKDEDKTESTNDNDSKKEDNLWADFLADVEEKKPETSKSSKMSWSALLGTKKKPKIELQNGGNDKARSTISPITKDVEQSKTDTVKVTKVFEFAGEEVRVEEEVAAECIQAKASSNSLKTGSTARPEKSKLQDLVGLIGNKKKLSTLEKTKLDWLNFKTTEGISDELQSHLKSKDGYLEKKDFLERANFREYEIERDMKMQQRRSNR